MVASPFWKCRSLRHTPAAPILISTSPRLGGSSSTVSIEYGLLTSYSTAAVIRMGPLPVATVWDASGRARAAASLAEIVAQGKSLELVQSSLEKAPLGPLSGEGECPFV